MKDLSILISGEPEVEVNGKTYSIAKKHKEKYLETTKPLLIQHRRQEDSNVIEELKAEIEAETGKGE